MEYTIDQDRIFIRRRIETACNFDPDGFKKTAVNIGELLNKRKLIGRRIVARGLTESDGQEYETPIAEFILCEQKIKQLLGL